VRIEHGAVHTVLDIAYIQHSLICVKISAELLTTQPPVSGTVGVSGAPAVESVMECRLDIGLAS